MSLRSALRMLALSSGLLITVSCGPPVKVTVPICLDCVQINRWFPPVDDEQGEGLQATLYLVYNYDDERCSAQLEDFGPSDGVRDMHLGLPPSLYLGLPRPDGRVNWHHVEVDAVPRDPGEPQLWAVTLGPDELEGLGDLQDPPVVSLRGPCNGRDDDCDGNVDEAIPTTCGEGECASEGVLRCAGPDDGVAGGRVDTCEPGEPTGEICDGLDNDCDGQVDQGLCFDGPWASKSRGICRPGLLQCDPETGAEICAGQVAPELEARPRPGERDPVDDDCDGVANEYTMACGDCAGDGSMTLDEMEPGGIERVIVSLVGDDPLPDDASDRAEQVAALQQRVIAAAQESAGNEGHRFEVVRRYALVPAFAAEADEPAIRALLNNTHVERVTRDSAFAPALAEIDERVGATEARQAASATGRGVRVAVLDTGIDPTSAVFGRCGGEHPSCAIIAGFDAVEGDVDPTDPRAHGTDIAQIIAGRATAGRPRGVAPESEVVAVRVVGPDGHATLIDLIAALDWLMSRPELGVRVVNLSVQSAETFGPAACLVAGGVLEQIFAELRDRGVLTIAAAGNHGETARRLSAPACLPSVVAAGATYTRDAAGPIEHHAAGCMDDGAEVDGVPCFSAGQRARPPFLRLLAPGDVTTMSRAGRPVLVAAGTSVSSAVLSGVAAALLSTRSELTPEELIEQLFTSGARVATPDVFARRADLTAAAELDCPDDDGDGYGQGPDCAAPVDCDDADGARSPGQIERLDGIDNDCDQQIDEASACEALDRRERGLLPACNMTQGRPEDLDLCLQSPGPCADPELLQAFCTRRTPGRADAWLLTQLPEMEAQHPGRCLEWAPVVEGDGERWMHCVTFADQACADSTLAYR